MLPIMSRSSNCCIAKFIVLPLPGINLYCFTNTLGPTYIVLQLAFKLYFHNWKLLALGTNKKKSVSNIISITFFHV